MEIDAVRLAVPNGGDPIFLPYIRTETDIVLIDAAALPLRTVICYHGGKW